MSRLPVLKPTQVLNALEKAGFLVARRKGSHVRLRHDDGRVTTVPVHSGRDIGRGLLRKILRDVEMSPEELSRLLE